MQKSAIRFIGVQLLRHSLNNTLKKILLIQHLIILCCFNEVPYKSQASTRIYNRNSCLHRWFVMKQCTVTGRLNVLANVCRKPLHQLFTQFAGLEAEDDVSTHLYLYTCIVMSLYPFKW